MTGANWGTALEHSQENWRRGRRRTWGAALAAVAVLLALPASALGVNAYGQTFAGEANCLSCHGAKTGRWQTGTYVGTNHDLFITDVEASPTALAPAASYWPSPAYGGGLSFGAGDIKWMLAAPTMAHQYVTKYRNSGSYVLGSGMTLNAIAGPADDWLMTTGLEWATPLGLWENGSKTGVRTYFQSCGGCHFLGLTRPTNAAYTLANGASVSTSTPTSFEGAGIQCEHCHGTGRAGTSHWTSGVDIVRTKQALKSQTCGQCHVNGTAKEKNFAGTTFSSPNGFTPDRNLEDFYNVYGTQYIKTSPSMTPPSIPTTDTRLYPNGSNKGMHHSYYNEWMLSKHARSLKYRDGSFWSPRARESCIKCHSGEAFLARLGYGVDGPNDVALAGSSLASDTLNIECGICHAVHAKTGDALGLRMPEEELCTACHTAELAAGAELEAGKSVHHPQSEMIEGFGMIGVPAPSEPFMDETTCADCHMPKTRGELVSHSFKIMKPGDAETWGVPAHGDSCTPCHASKSRAQLQADLDEWTEGIESLTGSAEAQIASAAARPESTTAEGVELLGSARTNVDYVESDGSHGAHNYPYAAAGLRKAAFFARAVGSSFGRFGATGYDKTMQLSMAYGTLLLGDGEPAAGQRVTIEARPAGSSEWAAIGAVTTGDDGDFAYAVSPAGTTSYRASWSPKPGVAFRSGNATVTMASTTSISSTSARFALGRSTSLSGAVSPAHAGAKVTVRYKRYSTGTWRTLSTRTLDANSTYALTWKPGLRGTYYLKAVFSGDESHAGSTSTTIAVKVY